MGQSFSRSRRRNDDRQTYSHQVPHPPPPSSPPALNPPYNPSSRPNFSTPYYNYPPTHADPYYYAYQQQLSRNYNSLLGFFQSWVSSAFPSYYRPNHGNVWQNSAAPHSPAAMPPYSYFSAAASSSTVVTPPPYVEHQQTKTIKNDVNLHKDMIRLEVDAQNPEEYLVYFVYDAIVDGR